jgi:hypothetical protein
VARESQEKRLARYRDRIEASRQWRENKGYVQTWRRMIDLYRGQQIQGEGDQAMVNMAFSVHNVVVAAVTTQYPKFTVSPNQIGQDDQAVIAEAVLNYAWKHYQFHDEFQAAVVDTSMIGHGWLKIGWRYRERMETVTLSPEEQMAQVEQGKQQADQIAQAAATDPQAAEIAPSLPTDEEIEDAVKPTQEVPNVLEDDPFCERISPFDIVIDPEACVLRELRWIAQRSIRDIKEIHEDPAYDARNRRKVEADLTTGTGPDDDYRDREGDPGYVDGNDDDRATVWEFYDLQENEWCVFAESGDGFLVKPDKILSEAFPNPFVMFRDYDVPDCFYPIGEIESMEELQEEINKTRTQQINARKQYVRKFIGREAALNPKAKEALMSEIDGDVAFVTDDDRPLNDLIIPAPSLSFDPQLFIAHSGQIVQDMQMVTGLSDYQFGQMPDTRRLATEAMAVEGATNARSSYKLTRIERTLSVVGRHLLAVMQQFMDAQRVARVAGPGGEMLFTFTPEDIKGEFDLNVEAGSTQPKNDMIRRQEAVTLFNTLAPFMGTIVDPHELIRYLLQQGYDIKNVDRFFVPPAPLMPPGAPGTPPGAPGQMPMEGGAGPAGSAAPGPAPANGQAPAPPVPAGV